MKYIELFNEVLECEKDTETAITVCMMYALNCAKKVKRRHIERSGVFTSELHKKIRSVFCEVQNIDRCIDLFEAVYSWEISCALGGLGGSDPKKRITDFVKKRN